jgi:hypothetical protein
MIYFVAIFALFAGAVIMGLAARAVVRLLNRHGWM